MFFFMKRFDVPRSWSLITLHFAQTMTPVLALAQILRAELKRFYWHSMAHPLKFSKFEFRPYIYRIKWIPSLSRAHFSLPYKHTRLSFFVKFNFPQRAYNTTALIVMRISCVCVHECFFACYHCTRTSQCVHLSSFSPYMPPPSSGR